MKRAPLLYIATSFATAAALAVLIWVHAPIPLPWVSFKPLLSYKPWPGGTPPSDAIFLGGGGACVYKTHGEILKGCISDSPYPECSSRCMVMRDSGGWGGWVVPPRADNLPPDAHMLQLDKQHCIYERTARQALHLREVTTVHPAYDSRRLQQ